MTTTQISRKDNRTPIYYIGLVREGRKLIIQAKESIDDLSCEITDYLGVRQVSKATIEANKEILLAGFKALPKYRNCDIVVVEEQGAEYEHHQDEAFSDWERIAEAKSLEITRLHGVITEYKKALASAIKFIECTPLIKNDDDRPRGLERWKGLVEEPEEEYKRPEMDKYKQVAYLEQVQKAFTQLYNAMSDFNRIWGRDDRYDLDLNDFLASQYPLGRSFDELMLDVQIWYQTGWTALNRKKKVLQGYPHDKVYGVAQEEPPNVDDKAIEYLAMNQLIRKRNKELTEMLDVLKGFFKPQYWLIVVWADVEPELHGPFTSESERDANAKELRRKEGEENGYYRLDINGVTPSINNFSGAFFEDEEEAGVGEPPAPYYTPEQAEGKWICAYDTMCGGWDCVRYSGGEQDGLPVLYNSQKEVETDDFFDGDDDFAIPATEFIEGRKAIFGGNGLHITGTPIVKGYKIEGATTAKMEEPTTELKYKRAVAKAWQSNEFFPTDVDIIILELSVKDRAKLLEAMEKCRLYGYDYIAIHAGSGADYYSGEDEKSDFRTDVEYFKVFKDCLYFYAQSKYDSGCQIESERLIIEVDLSIALPDHQEYEVEQG